MVEFVVILLLALAGWSSPQTPEPPKTLEHGLSIEDRECILSGMSSKTLTTLVDTFWATRIDDDCLIAWERFADYPSKSTGGVIVGNPETGVLKEKAITFDQAGDVTQWPGRIDRVERSHGLLLVGARVAIDGRAYVLFDRDLNEVGRLYGLAPVTLPTGIVLYQRGHPHFAPTHYVELAAYDTRSKAAVAIFPKEPFSPVRREFMAKTQAIYDRETFDCAGRNHHCNAEWFNDYIGEIVASSDGKAVAFLVHYESEADDEPWPETVIATCDGFPALQTVSCRETPIDEWRSAFPGLQDDALVARAAAEPRRFK